MKLRQELESKKVQAWIQSQRNDSVQKMGTDDWWMLLINLNAVYHKFQFVNLPAPP